MNHSDFSIDYAEIYFSGGIKGTLDLQTNILSFRPTLKSEKIVKECLSEYPSISHLAYKYGLLIVGYDEFLDKEQKLGIYPPKWTPFTYDKFGQYYGILEKLSGIRNCAYNNKNFEFVYTLHKIEEWLKASARALKSISVSYHTTLSARCLKEKYIEYEFFDDMNCDFIYDSIHNFLYYIGTLRDHISEFIVKYLSNDESNRYKKIDTMIELKKYIENNKNCFLVNTIKNKILEAYDINNQSNIIPGWLYYISEYRNAITHKRPINMIDYRKWAYQLLTVRGENSIPQLKFPLPEIPLAKERLYNDQYVEEKMTSFPSKENAQKSQDALEVFLRIYLELLNFIDDIIDYSPLKPQIISLNSTNAFNFRSYEI